MSQTITESLAELKTIDKRIESKKVFVFSHLFRQEMVKDPLEKDGGSLEMIRRERQGIHDLLERKVTLRRAITSANQTTTITIGVTTRSIHDWLVWRREASPTAEKFLKEMRTNIDSVRQEFQKKGFQVSADACKPGDVIVNLNEADLAKQLEELTETLGKLDGLLSLKNATITVEV